MHVNEEFPQINTVQEAIDYGERITDDKLRIVYLEISVLGYKKDLLLALFSENEEIIKQYQKRLALYLTALNIALNQNKYDKQFYDIGQVAVMMATDNPNLQRYNEVRSALSA